MFDFLPNPPNTILIKSKNAHIETVIIDGALILDTANCFVTSCYKAISHDIPFHLRC